MIGKISIGKSFRGCISYCLENKREKMANLRTLNDRSEVLAYHLCYGNKLELIKQFGEVRNLNPKLSSPVMHITLSLTPGEQIEKGKLISLAEDCAADLGFSKNQYIVVTHHDTPHQHLHLVVNRVGFDGKTVTDSHNYQKMAAYCRRMEQKHNLQQVLSPKRFLPKDLRNIERFDSRKKKLQQDIRASLTTSGNYKEFENQMKRLGYQVLKARGIAFIDPKKVRVKGSEVGFSLATIEKVLVMHSEKRITYLGANESKSNGLLSSGQQTRINYQSQDLEKQKAQQKALIANLLLKPSPAHSNLPPLLPKKKRKKNKSRHI